MNTDNTKSSNEGNAPDKTPERASNLHRRKVVLNVIGNTLVFASVFGLGLRYARSNPIWLHKSINEMVRSFEYSEVSLWSIKISSVQCLKLILTLWFVTPIVFVANNVFQPRLVHVFTVDFILDIWTGASKGVLNRQSLKAAFPMWVCAILGLFGVFLIDISSFGVFPNPATPAQWAIGSFGSVLLVSLYNYSLVTSEIKSLHMDYSDVDLTGESVLSSEADELSYEQLISWLESDTPSGFDLFGTRLREKSRQLRDLIINQKAGQKIQSIGIVGKHGAGKSSLVEFLKRDLHRDSRFIFCQVSTWRFDESATAIHHILSEVLKEVNKDVDTFRVRKLPDTFRKGFSSFGGEFLDKLSDMTFGDESLNDRLDKLDRILIRAEKILVLVVEDLDRDSDSKVDLGQVQAFLHMLKKYCSIVTIISGDPAKSKHNRIDFDKLCDSLVELNLPNTNGVAKVLSKLKKHYIQRISRDFDCYLLVDQIEYLMVNPYQVESEKTPGLVLSVVRMLENPRAIKHAIRRTVSAIENNLCCEVDWDHLFIVNVIRKFEPRALSFIDAFYQDLKIDGMAESIGQFESDKGDSEALLEIRNRIVSEWDKIAVEHYARRELETAVKYLYEKYCTTDLAGEQKDLPLFDKPQGIKSIRHWKRMLSEVIGDGEVLDREIIKDYAAWVSEVNNAFVEKCTSVRDYSLGMDCLKDHIFYDNYESSKRLLKELSESCCNRVRAGKYSETNSVRIAAARFLIDFEESEVLDKEAGEYESDVVYSLLYELITNAVGSDLTVCSILQRLVVRLGNCGNDMYFDLFDRIPTLIQKVVLKPGSFIDLLHRNAPGSLCSLIVGWNDPQAGVNWDSPLDKWQWIRSDILDACNQGDTHIQYAVFLLLTHNNSQSDVIFNDSIGGALFGDTYDEIKDSVEYKF